MKPRWIKKQSNLWPINYKNLFEEYNSLNNEYQFFFNKLKVKKIDIPFQIRPFVATTKPINFKQFINFNEVDLIYNCKIDSIDENKKVATAYSSDNRLKLKAKKIIYQSIEDMKQAVRDVNPDIQNFEASCFDGFYVTGDITESYLDALEAARNTSAAKADRQKDSSDFARSQLHLHLATED